MDINSLNTKTQETSGLSGFLTEIAAPDIAPQKVKSSKSYRKSLLNAQYFAKQTKQSSQDLKFKSILNWSNQIRCQSVDSSRYQKQIQIDCNLRTYVQQHLNEKQKLLIRLRTILRKHLLFLRILFFWYSKHRRYTQIKNRLSNKNPLLLLKQLYKENKLREQTRQNKGSLRKKTVSQIKITSTHNIKTMEDRSPMIRTINKSVKFNEVMIQNYSSQYNRTSTILQRIFTKDYRCQRVNTETYIKSTTQVDLKSKKGLHHKTCSLMNLKSSITESINSSKRSRQMMGLLKSIYTSQSYKCK